MKKDFCDLCSNPAVDYNSFVQLPYGDSYVFEDRRKHCRIIVRAEFYFQDHPKGFEGPPDLCADCANKLLAKLQVPSTNKDNNEAFIVVTDDARGNRQK